MKITKAKKQDVLSNNQQPDAMNFDIGDVSVIIEILRNRLYSNPIQTLTQEYLSNGRDATREAKSDRPLKVTLPTGLDSVLKIRDYGVGLSPERVREVFVLYGASTKRTDNNQTGGFGIGAKSAWAYTDSFTVVSYHNKKVYTYIAHTGENANGIFEKIAEEPTQEPNGVEIQIPVKQEHREQFINAVYRSTLFWKVKPVLAGITEAEIPVEYKNFFSQITHEKDNWKIVKSNTFFQKVLNFHGHSQNVMLSVDGIPYPLNKFYNDPAFSKLMRSFGYENLMVLDVSNGDVEVSATREAVSDKEASKRNIVDKVNQVNDSLAQYIKDQVEMPQETLFDYIVNYNKITQGFSRELWPKFNYSAGELNFKINHFRNLELPPSLEIKPFRFNLRTVRGGKINLVTDEALIDLSRNNIFFVIRDSDDSQNKTKEKIRALLESKNNALNTKDVIVYLLEGYKPEFAEIVETQFKAVKLSALTYEATKKESKKRSTDKITVRFITYEGTQRWNREYVVRTQENATFDELNANNAKYVIVPFSSEEEFSKSNSQFLAWIRFLKTHGNYHVVKLSNRDFRLAKENLDNVVEYIEIIKKVPELVKLSQETVTKMSQSLKFRSSLNSLSAVSKQIEDEELKEFVMGTTIQDPNQNQDADIEVFIQEQYPEYQKLKADYDKKVADEGVFNQRYPILRHIDYRAMDQMVKSQIVECINFLWSQRNPKTTTKKAKKS